MQNQYNSNYHYNYKVHNDLAYSFFLESTPLDYFGNALFHMLAQKHRMEYVN